MFNLSLKRKILLCIGLALLSVILLLSGFSYHNLRQQIVETNDQQIAELSSKSAQTIATWLKEKQTAIHTLNQQGKYQDPASMLLVRDASDFLGIFFGSKQGAMIDEEPDDDATQYQGYDPRQESWYQAAQSYSTPVQSKPYLDETYSPPEIVFSVVEAQPLGVLGGDISTQRMQQILRDMKLPADGFTVLIDEDHDIIAFRDPKQVLKPLSTLIPGLDNKQIASLLRNHVPAEINWHGADKLVWATEVPNSRWTLISVIDKQILLAPLQQQLLLQLLISASVLIVSLLAIGALVGVLFRPLRRVSKALSLIASGDGDLTQRIPVHTQDEVGQLAANFNQFVGSLHELIGHIRHEAESLSHSAAMGLKRSADTVRELGDQQQEIAMVATAVTEMASATTEIAHNAENTAAAAQQSSVSSADGRNLVNQTRGSITTLANEVGEATEVITELSRHANDISSVLGTIQSIAEQTNLLALNAAIEAARAGEQGRGFAVVADEVRVLSKRTQASTTEIQSTIDTLQRTTQQAVALMEKSQALASHSVADAEAASKALDEITQAVSLISDMSTQIATAAEEQTKVTEEITTNVTAIKEVGDELAKGAHNEQQESRRLQEQAADLNDKVARFIL